MTDTATATTTWTIDPAHSVVEFAVKHMMFTTAKGRFQDFSGAITLDEQNVGSSSVDVTIQPASINTQAEDRDAHLRGVDFFDAERFPDVTFRSTSVESAGGDDLRITGDLTITGVTRQVVLDAAFQGRGKNPWGQEVIGYEATTRFNRKDFGLTWNQALESGGVLVSEEVKLNLDIQAGLAS